ncbi:MAG: hypothetical protein ACRDTM_03425 [Micromonosporaceae bacterium]
MGVFETLKARGNRHGVAVRPHSNDGFPPAGGTPVAWVVAQPVQDMLDQAKTLGWADSGTIGNGDHLRKHGDHTPWSHGKKRGILYAKDTKDPPWLEKELLKLCRKPDYDTTWIDFINVNGSQYNFAGKRVADSGDFHLHISVRAGKELTRVTLFRDIARQHNGQPVSIGKEDFLMALTSAEQKRLLKNVDDTHFMLSSKAADLGHPFQLDRRDWSAKLDAILKAVRGDDSAEIVAAIKEQGEQTRAALLAKIGEIAPTLAGEVAEQLETELNETELADALAAALTARLAT